MELDLMKYFKYCIYKKIKEFVNENDILDIIYVQIEPFLNLCDDLRLKDVYNKDLLTREELFKTLSNYEKNQISEYNYAKFLARYFVPQKEFREALLNELRQEIQRFCKYNYEFDANIKFIMDLEGNTITDILKIPYTTKLLFAGASEISLEKLNFIQGLVNLKTQP